jgi:hypothetical protein
LSIDSRNRSPATDEIINIEESSKKIPETDTNEYNTKETISRLRGEDFIFNTALHALVTFPRWNSELTPARNTNVKNKKNSGKVPLILSDIK